MGYYTDFTLTVSDIDVEIQKEIDKMNVFDDFYCDTYYANAKWYEYEADMSLLSEKFPDVLFELTGWGEEREDMWVAYFLGGKSQYCRAKIEYEPFDKDKLVFVKPLEYTKYSYEGDS